MNQTSADNHASVPDQDYQREELHLRRIEMRGYRRSDGLFEVEGWVTDQKTDEFTIPAPGRTVPAGDFVHRMGVRLVFDESLMVHEVHTMTRDAPFEHCAEGGRALSSMKGVRMVSGWTNEVRSRLRGAASCTHLMEILIPMATAAHQSLGYIRINQPARVDENGRPRQIDSCYGYAADGPVVLHRWPQFHKSNM